MKNNLLLGFVILISSLLILKQSIQIEILEAENIYSQAIFMTLNNNDLFILNRQEDMFLNEQDLMFLSVNALLKANICYDMSKNTQESLINLMDVLILENTLENTE